MIEAITFDLWDTLIRETPDSARKVKEARIRNLYVFLEGYEYPGTLEQVEKAHERVGERLKEIWARNEDVGAEAQVQLFLEALDDGWHMPQDRMALSNLEWAYVSAVLHASPVLNHGAAELLDGLRTQHRLGLICNTGRVPGTMLKIILQRLGILEHFDVLTFSDVVGIRKPDPQIFHLTLEPLGVPPERALHVGDNISADILGARGVGMWAVLLGPHEASLPEDARARAIVALEELPRVLEEVAEGVRG
ncbi:MAG: HAD family hydrolase [Candidatus Methylomirabilales bacterium]